ncbi:MAG: hypothetical protein RLZZ505_2286 [Verrucomicrobiota bacterium]|jgi:DNA replication protein DnaC
MNFPTPISKTCQRCPNPALESEVELAETFPALGLSVLCKTCGDAEQAAERERLAAQRWEQEQAARRTRLEVIPPKIRRTETGHPNFNLGLWIRVEDWQPTNGKSLGLVGGAGRCKTRCLGLLAQKLILAGHILEWTTAVEFQERADDLKSADRAIKASAEEYFRQCKKAAITVLDDIGKNTWTPTVERLFFSLIDHRTTHDLPILWSANSHPIEIGRSGAISKNIAAPLIGRIIESSTIITL